LSPEERLKNARERVRRVADICERSRGHMQYTEFHFAGYGEPGYDDPEIGIIATGNWNNDDTYDQEKRERVVTSTLPSRVAEVLEKLGVEIEWSDEWSSCSDCGKLVRTSADSYCWQPSYVCGDGELLCHECVEQDPEEHLKSLEDNERACNTIDSIDPADHGYIAFNEDSYESGWHPGQTDDPAKIAKELRERGVSRFVFQLDENSQFYSKWSVFVHEDEAHLVGLADPPANEDDDSDVEHTSE
jgi:hypothetical protein